MFILSESNAAVILVPRPEAVESNAAVILVPRPVAVDLVPRLEAGRENIFSMNFLWLFQKSIASGSFNWCLVSNSQNAMVSGRLKSGRIKFFFSTALGSEVEVRLERRGMSLQAIAHRPAKSLEPNVS